MRETYYNGKEMGKATVRREEVAPLRAQLEKVRDVLLAGEIIALSDGWVNWPERAGNALRMLEAIIEGKDP